MDECEDPCDFFRTPNLYSRVRDDDSGGRWYAKCAARSPAVARFVALASAVRRAAVIEFNDSSRLDVDRSDADAALDDQHAAQLVDVCEKGDRLPLDSWFVASLQWAIGNLLCDGKPRAFADVFATALQWLCGVVDERKSDDENIVFVLAALALITRNRSLQWTAFTSYLRGDSDSTADGDDNDEDRDDKLWRVTPLFDFYTTSASRFPFLSTLAKQKPWCYNVAGALCYVAMHSESYGVLFALLNDATLMVALSSLALGELQVSLARSLWSMYSDKTRHGERALHFDEPLLRRLRRLTSSRIIDDACVLLSAFSRLQAGKQHARAADEQRARFGAARDDMDGDDALATQIESEEDVAETRRKLESLQVDIDDHCARQKHFDRQLGALIAWLRVQRFKLAELVENLQDGFDKQLASAVFAALQELPDGDDDKAQPDAAVERQLVDCVSDDNFERFWREIDSCVPEELADGVPVAAGLFIRYAQRAFGMLFAGDKHVGVTPSLVLVALRHHYVHVACTRATVAALLANLRRELVDVERTLRERRADAKVRIKLRQIECD